MKNVYLFLIGLVALSGCTQSKKDMLNQINGIANAKIQNGENKAKMNALKRQFIEQFPEDSLAKTFHEDVIVYYELVDSFDLSLQLAEQYLSLYPNSEALSDLYLTMGHAYTGLGKYTSALSYFEKTQEARDLTTGELRDLDEILKNLVDSASGQQKADYIRKRAGVAQVISTPMDAMMLYHELYTDFPNSSYAPFAMMQHASVLESTGDLAGAQELLEKLIKTYPESSFAKDAERMIKLGLLGKSAEEQLEIILNQAS